MQTRLTGCGVQGSPWESRPARTQGVLLLECLETGSRAGSGPAVAEIMGRRSAALERALTKGWRVMHAVHRAEPSIAEGLREAQRAGVERLVVVPVRPLFTESAMGEALSEVYRCLAESHSAMHVEVRSWWHDDAGYTEAHAQLIHAFAVERGLSPLTATLTFSAAEHEVAACPFGRRAFVEAAGLIRRRLGWPAERTRMVYAGGVVGDDVAVDPSAPALAVSLSRITSGASGGRAGAPEADHADHADGAAVHACPPPDTSDSFMKALTHVVRRGRQAAGGAADPAPLFTEADPRALVDREIETLVMAGVCVESPLGPGRGPGLHHCEHDELRRFKRPHLETLDLLRRVAEAIGARECFIWNTCSRYELYAWLPAGTTREHRRAMAHRAASEVFGAGVEHANLLLGPDARHHALRTAAGLNSALVGDAEVVEQLRAARAAAQYAGTAGELTGAFIEDIAGTVRDLRDRTAWGGFEHRYCDAALSRLEPLLKNVLPGARCLVVGGSTTSCSALETLTGRYGVPSRDLSLIFRGHRKGALVKRLHAAVGEGSVSIVEEYNGQGVLEAVVEADLVIFAVDQRQPIFTLEEIARRRRPGARPLLILDFNTFGSVEVNGAFDGVRFIDASFIDGEVKAFNREKLAQTEMVEGVREAESWIGCCAGTVERRCGVCPSLRSDRCPCSKGKVHS